MTEKQAVESFIHLLFFFLDITHPSLPSARLTTVWFCYCFSLQHTTNVHFTSSFKLQAQCLCVCAILLNFFFMNVRVRNLIITIRMTISSFTSRRNVVSFKLTVWIKWIHFVLCLSWQKSSCWLVLWIVLN